MNLKVINEYDTRKQGGKRKEEGKRGEEVMNLPVKKTIQGKEYSVKLNKEQKITDVWDDVQNIYVPYRDFLRTLLEIGDVNEANKVIIVDKNDDKKEEIKEDKIDENREIEEVMKSKKPMMLPKITKDKRTIAGKLRSVTLVYGKINDVYDDITKKYLPIDDFMKLYNYKEEILDIDKKPDKQVIPTNIVKTSISTSGIMETIPLPNGEKKEEKKFEKEEKKFEFPYLDIDYIYEMI